MGDVLPFHQSPSDKNSADSSDLIIDVNYSLPFVVDQNTSVEHEVKAVMKDCIEMLKSYGYKVLILVIILLGVLYFQGVLMFMSDTYYMRTNRIPLLDRVHELLEKYDHPFSVPFCNTMMYVFVWTGILRIVLFTPFFYLCQMAIRYVTLFGTGYFIRGFFVYLTTMPSCYLNCNPDLERRPFFAFAVRIIAGYMGLTTNCSDLIISGHTMFTVLTCILFVENVKYLATKIVLVLFTGFTLFLIVACKYHYTVDILFGLILSVLMHYYYYSKIDGIGVYTVNKIYNGNSKSFQQMRKTQILSSFLARLFSRMELLEERLVVGQKMRALYTLVNSQKELIDRDLLKRFNHMVRLFGADESDDLLTLYRGTRNMNLYYWKYLYRKIFKKKQNVVYF